MCMSNQKRKVDLKKMLSFAIFTPKPYEWISDQTFWVYNLCDYLTDKFDPMDGNLNHHSHVSYCCLHDDHHSRYHYTRYHYIRCCIHCSRYFCHSILVFLAVLVSHMVVLVHNTDPDHIHCFGSLVAYKNFVVHIRNYHHILDLSSDLYFNDRKLIWEKCSYFLSIPMSILLYRHSMVHKSFHDLRNRDWFHHLSLHWNTLDHGYHIHFLYNLDNFDDNHFDRIHPILLILLIQVDNHIGFVVAVDSTCLICKKN